MQISNAIKILFLLLSFDFLFSDLIIAESFAQTYYIATNGSDSQDGSINSPWATFNHAMTRLQPGDVLIIKDGTYHQSLNITISGTSGQSITFKAQNDGKVIIDGQGKLLPLHIDGTTVSAGTIQNIIVEGIKFQNSIGHVIDINEANRIVLRRVSAYNAPGGNYHVFSLRETTNSLLEDCAASETGRQMYNVLKSDNVIMRRCWGRYQYHSDYPTGSDGFNQTYGSSNCIVENCIGTMDPSANRVAKGAGVWANTGMIANRNKFLGNVMYNLNGDAYFNSTAENRITGNIFMDNVSINNTYFGFYQRGDDNCEIRRMTVVGPIQRVILMDPSVDLTSDIKCDIRNSTFSTGDIGFHLADRPSSTAILTHEYNNLYNLSTPYKGTSQGTGEISVNPGFNTSKYGKGGYLFVPDGSPLKTAGEGGTQIGAEVLYRYHNGVLTEEPLWPWPMEERIMKETGVSVTWEANGGLWKTLDGIYSGNQESFGFSLANAGDVSVTMGSSVSNSITSTLNFGSSETVSYTVSGLPYGVTATFTPSSCIPNCSTTLTINSKISAPEGTYTITVTGTAGDVSASTSFMLTIKALPQAPMNSLYTPTSITINGVLSEDAWNETETSSFSNPSRSDNQVKVYTLWNNNYLYVAYEVSDLHLEAENQVLYQDDGAELYLDTQNDKTATMGADDYQFIININELTDPTFINAKTVTQANGYVMEISIPWTSINTSPFSNKTLGLLFANTDRDNGNITRFDWLDLIESGHYKRPQLWGEILLSGSNGGDDNMPPSPPTGLRVEIQQSK